MDIKYKNKTINIKLSKYPYRHGFGFEARVTDHNTLIGIIQFLCDKADENYKKASELNESELIEKLSSLLISGKLESTIDMVYDMKEQTKLEAPELIAPCSKWY